MLVKSAKGIRRGFDRDWGKELAFLGRSEKAPLGSLKAEDKSLASAQKGGHSEGKD